MKAWANSPLVRMTCLALLVVVLISGQSIRSTIPAAEDAPRAVAANPAPTVERDTPILVSNVQETAQPAPPLPSLEGDTSVVYRICRVTAYCDRGTTACGVPSGVGQCAAPGDIPFGATVYIPELDRTFVVTDRTHRRFRRSTVDIFIPSHAACLEFGCRFLECEFTVPAE
jgi:3D (Asp-Asp-Asp) domain-containing protein